MGGAVKTQDIACGSSLWQPRVMARGRRVSRRGACESPRFGARKMLSLPFNCYVRGPPRCVLSRKPFL